MAEFCQDCGTKLIGRIDKKFCNDQCRNNFNNRLNRDETAFMTQVNRHLRKNRRILKLLTPKGKAKVKKREMEAEGFNFKYFTHVYKTKEGRIYYFCYEFGYLPLDNNYFALVVNQDI